MAFDPRHGGRAWRGGSAIAIGSDGPAHIGMGPIFVPQELRRRRSPLTDVAAAPILRPMRVLFSSLPATGHVNSLMPMALAVRAAGHDVAVCTSPAYAAQIEGSGLRHLPGGVDRFKELFDGAPPYGDPGRIRWVQTIVFGTRAPVRMIPDLLRHVEAWQPDLLVRESGEHGAALVAETVGLAHAGISGGSWASHDARRGLLAEALDAHRPALGLPPDPTNETMFRYLQLAFSPPSWDADALLPRTVQFIRYDNPERAGEADPPWLDVSRGRPLVLASLGTVMNDQPGLMEAIVAAWRRGRRRCRRHRSRPGPGALRRPAAERAHRALRAADPRARAERAVREPWRLQRDEGGASPRRAAGHHSRRRRPALHRQPRRGARTRRRHRSG